MSPTSRVAGDAASLTSGPSPGGRGEPDRPEALSTARWLASIRRPDGSLGVTVALPEPGWATPFALLLWAAVGGFETERSAALGWLLGREGKTDRRSENDPLGHDPTIVGWPWVADTHSWVEPTALALLALAREGRGDHPRSAEGARMLVDRAIPGGGWNLGNPVIFGTTLRPLPGPTGLALLALSGRMGPSASPLTEAGRGRSSVIAPAIAYLQASLRETLAPISLGWGLLGLRAWGAEPPEAQSRLASAFDRLASREPRADELAMLLLASGRRSLDVLGIAERQEGSRHA